MDKKWFKIIVAATALAAVLMTAMYLYVIGLEKKAAVSVAEAQNSLQEALQGISSAQTGSEAVNSQAAQIQDQAAQPKPLDKPAEDAVYSFGSRKSAGFGQLDVFADDPLNIVFLLPQDRLLTEDEHHSVYICRRISENGSPSPPYIGISRNELSKDAEKAAAAYGSVIELSFAPFGLEVKSPLELLRDSAGRSLYAATYQYTILGQVICDREYFLETADALYVISVKAAGEISDELELEAALVLDSLDDSTALYKKLH